MSEQTIPQETWDSKINPLLDELKLDSDQLCELIIELLDQGLEMAHFFKITGAIKDLEIDLINEKD
jgi:hypothetical protein